jgi:hypothetical protein
MKTKTELIAELKAEYPSLNRGEDDQVIALTSAEYEETISAWADSIIENELQIQKALEAQIAKKDAIAKLKALGIDPKVLGLEVDEAEVI